MVLRERDSETASFARVVPQPLDGCCIDGRVAYNFLEIGRGHRRQYNSINPINKVVFSPGPREGLVKPDRGPSVSSVRHRLFRRRGP